MSTLEVDTIIDSAGTGSPSFPNGLAVSKAVAGTTNTDATNTGSVILDFTTNQNFVLTLTGNVTLDNPTTEVVGQSGFIVFIQDATGSRTVSLGADYETAAGAGLALSSAASATDVVPYIVAASGRILLGTPQLAFAQGLDMPFGSSQWMYSSGFYPTEIDQSLMFDGTAYLSRTPSVAGNRKTWTFSTWVKLGKIGTASTLFSSGADGSNKTEFTFRADGRFQLFSNTSGIPVGSIVWSPNVYRDPSAWYHLSLVCDTTNATNTNRFRFYVNGVQVTGISGTGGENTWPSQNADLHISTNVAHSTGRLQNNASDYFNGYMADTYFVDGTALDPTNFGEFKNGVWIPKAYTGSYGTNGFHLTYQDDTVSEGFNTVTWTGNGQDNTKISGIGFSPDLVWIKTRSVSDNHVLSDSVRGGNRQLFSNLTEAEFTSTSQLKTFDSDGFTLGTDSAVNGSGRTLAAWAWDAGSSTVSNTDGSITSSVRANPAYGFSIVTWAGNSTNGATVGHGLSSAPSILITKSRTNASSWIFGIGGMSGFGVNDYLTMQTTNAKSSSSTFYQAYGTNTFTTGVSGGAELNKTGNNYVTYCFSEIAGYSKIGSYTGNGSASGPTVTLGFKPAFVMIKNTTTATDWIIKDSTRDTVNPIDANLRPNWPDPEFSNSNHYFDFTDTGFVVKGADNSINKSGDTIIYMAFADTRDLAFWRDQSGNGNDWQPTNLNYQDTVFDSPTNNYATLNPTIRPYTVTPAEIISEGNLKLTCSSNAVSGSAWGTLLLTTGKWYFESTITSVGGGSCNVGFSNNTTAAGLGTYLSDARAYGCFYQTNGQKVINNALTSYGASYTTSDVIGAAFDVDAGTVTFYKNNVSQGAITGLSLYSGSAGWLAAIEGFNGTVHSVNFGQSGFTYTPPTDFLALSTANLPEPSISPANGDSPQDYFNTVLYTGNSTARSISGVGFQPDWTWIKQRASPVRRHHLQDSVRGAGKSLFSDATTAEESSVNYLTSFDTDGFSLGTSSETNGNALTYAAWNWKASNATAVSNTSGSITSQVSANPTAGFSISKYTGTGSTMTWGHGLGATPDFFVVKCINRADEWIAYPLTATGNLTQSLRLNTTAAYTSDSVLHTANSSVLGFGVSGARNNSGDDYICYAFTSIEGYSKISSYTGNGSADGTFVYTGFRPAYVMIKVAGVSGYNWYVFDSVRSEYNLVDRALFPNTSGAEYTPVPIDFLSNGFKLKTTDGGVNNASYSPYIYMAFAENPFKYANARQE